MKLVHVISGLNVGGAELMMIRLAIALRAYVGEQVFISMSSDGPLSGVIRDKGFRLYTMGCKPGRIGAGAIFRLLKVYKAERPDITQSWMFHADLVGGLISKIACATPVVWNIRQSDTKDEKLSTRIIANCINKFFSYFIPDAIICCGNYVADFYKKNGYNSRLITAIPNGYVMPNGKKLQRTTAACDSANDFVVGISGRFHPMKDHQTFIAAAGLAYKNNKRLRFIICGNGLDENNSILAQWIADSGIPLSKISLLGCVSDMDKYYEQLDLFVSTSRGSEGFPNVLAEAMSHGVPCVATDIGGNAEVIGNQEFLVPIAAPVELSKLIISFSNMPSEEYQRISLCCHDRINKNYPIDLVAKRYSAVYEKILGH